MPLNATPGDPNANSYATVAEYDAYWGARPFNTAALALTVPQKEAALEQATMVEDAAFIWTGTIATDTQALGWPRLNMLDRFGRPVDQTIIPQALKNSVCQLAGDLAAGNRLADVDAQKQGIKSIKAGSVSLDFDVPSSNNVGLLDAALRRMGPDFDWASRGISDAARLLLVPSWYLRQSLMQPLVLETYR